MQLPRRWNPRIIPHFQGFLIAGECLRCASLAVHPAQRLCNLCRSHHGGWMNIYVRLVCLCRAKMHGRAALNGWSIRFFSSNYKKTACFLMVLAVLCISLASFAYQLCMIVRWSKRFRSVCMRHRTYSSSQSPIPERGTPPPSRVQRLGRASSSRAAFFLLIFWAPIAFPHLLSLPDGHCVQSGSSLALAKNCLYLRQMNNNNNEKAKNHEQWHPSRHTDYR